MSTAFEDSFFDFREKKAKRCALLGLGLGPIPTAGESLREFTPVFASSARAPRANARAAGGGEMAESTRGDECFDEPLGERPNHSLKLGELATGVSWEGVRL